MDIKYTILIVALLNLLIGALTLSNNRKNKLNISASLVAFILGLWSVSMFFYVEPIIYDSEFWIKVVYSFVVLMTISWSYFFKIFLKIKDKIIFSLIAIFGSIFACILLGTNYWVVRVEQKPWGPETILGPAYLFFGIYIIIVMAWITYWWVRRYLQERDVARKQLLYVFMGMIVYSVLATFFDVIVPIATGNSKFFWISSYFSLFFVGANAYAIIRYRLFDIKVILTEMLVGVMGIILFILPLIINTDPFMKALMFGVFAAYCLIGYLLIRSAIKETEAKEAFEQKVQERTKELETSKKIAEDRAAELEKWYSLTIGRELRMAELKEKIKEMEEKPK